MSETTAAGDAEALASASLAWLGVKAGGGPDVDAAAVVAPAVVDFINGLPDVAPPWPPKVELGAVMLAARLVRRRNSPQGVAAFTQEGGAAYVSRMDPDVAQLLRLGAYAAPQIG